MEEFNIFYVAITRTKFAIKIESANIKYMMSDWLNKLNKILFLISSHPLQPCYNKENERMYRNTNENFDYSYKNEEVFSNENEFIDSHTVLGLSENASKIDIKIQYKKLMRRYHPDLTKNKKDEYTEIAKKINGAYDCLMKIHA